MAKNRGGGGHGGGGGGSGHDAEAIENEVVGRFEKFFPFLDWKKFLESGARVYMRKLAEWLGKLMRVSLPVNSPFRSDIAEFVGYVGAAIIQAPKSAILKVIGEFVEVFVGTFCGGESEDDSVIRRSIPPELVKALAEKDGALAAKDFEELLNTLPSQWPDLKVIQTERRKFWHEGKQELMYGPPKTPEPQKPSQVGKWLKRQGQEFKAEHASFNASLAPKVAALKTKADDAVSKAEAEKAARRSGTVNKILGFPWKVIGAIVYPKK